MDITGQTFERRVRQAVDAGELDLWDLRPELETVHHSPLWKLRFGFPEPHSADSTHFWRCRVHPLDLEGMLEAIREHFRAARPRYEARFRLRSNGSGYRLVQSRGLVIERAADGRALRMVGTMVDLTERPCTPQGGLPEGPRGLMEGTPLTRPFHQLITGPAAGVDLPVGLAGQAAQERQRLMGLVGDLLQDSLSDLERMRTA